MKSNKRYIQKLSRFTLALVIGIFASISLQAQVRKDFTPRTGGVNPPSNGIYNLRGDFTMIGNTNMSITTDLGSNYSNNSNNSNNYMNFVKVDPNMVNSSTAALTFYQDNIVNPACSEIVYAGLYWTGRAHTNSNTMEWTYQSGSTNNRSNGNSFNGYSLSISQTGSNPRIATYTFTPQGGGSNVVFTFSSNGTTVNSVTYKVGNGVAQPITGYTTSNGGSDGWLSDSRWLQVSFTNPIVINTGSEDIEVTALRKRRENNSQNSSYFYATIKTGSITLNKRKVKIKGPGASNYTEVVANEEDIRYPGSADDYMYAGYADVTSYVQQYGTGNYTVADLALVEGNGGSVGFFGGWSMVVIYENAKMSWKDIVVFDGYAYLDGDKKTNYDLPISGFNAVQAGPVNVKVGIMAGEGDRGISGDYFRMKRNTGNTFDDLSHSGNSTNNFFNSSIVTGGNYRYPNYVNNTGLDIAMFNLNNSDKRYITNNQQSTTFRYGSTQDTYVIPLMVIGIDAYIPDVEAVNEIVSINGQPVTGNNFVVEPGQEVEYKIIVKNKGDEPVNNVKIEVPVPFTGSDLGGYTTFYHSAVGGTKSVTHESGQPGKIVWNVGNIPLLQNKDDVIATLTYKIKVTTNCAILNNLKCLTLSLNGSVTGIGATTEIPFHAPRLISGFNTSDECADIPLYEPFNIEIDPTSYFADPNNDCEQSDEYDLLTFEYCDIAVEGVPLDELKANFPAGTRFYSDFELYSNPDDEDDELEYVRGKGTEYGTTANPFPKTVGTHGVYYAIPPGFMVTCYWQFEIIVNQFCGNFWMGTENNLWNNSNNWTINIPNPEEDVVFATHNNNKGKPALKDLHVDADYVIGNLENNSDKDLIVKTGNSLTIKGKVIDDNAVAGTIIVESLPNQPTGTLLFTTVAGNTNVGATVQFYNKAYTCNDCGTPNPQQWQYFGVPVKTINSFPYTTGNPETIFEWSEAAFGNKWIIPTTPLAAFRGYEINNSALSTHNINPLTTIYNFAGTLNVGDATVPLTYTSSVNYKGWNLIGNSYTAAIPIATAISYSGGWNSTVYLFNAGSRNSWRKLTGNTEWGLESGRYVSVPLNTAGSGGLPSIIPSMHAFMIQTTSAGDLTLDYSKLTKNALVEGANGSNIAWRSASSQPTELPYIVMDVIGTQSADRVWLFENMTTTRGFDAGWDGEKMAESGLMQLYVKSDDELKLQVATVPQLQGTTLGVNPDNNDNFKISFSVSSEVEARGLHLRDLITGRAYPIRNFAEYSVAGVSGEVADRFKVVAIANENMSKQELGNSIIEVFTINNQIGITNNSDEKCMATIYDASGKMVVKIAVNEGVTQMIGGSYKINTGIYLVKVAGQTINESKRVMVK